MLEVNKFIDLKFDLSEQQKEAFDFAIAWFKDPDSAFVLRGYAETGKSFCAQRMSYLADR